MKRSLRSYIHVIIQFSAIFSILFTTRVFELSYCLVPVTAGLFLGVWSVWTMKHATLTIFPEPNFNIIIQHGPYKIIRHPMYTSLFLIVIPLVIFNFSFLRLGILMGFTLNQILKIMYEEKLILQKVPGYAAYKSVTWRIIPFLY